MGKGEKKRGESTGNTLYITDRRSNIIFSAVRGDDTISLNLGLGATRGTARGGENRSHVYMREKTFMKVFPPRHTVYTGCFAKLELFPYVYDVECMRECALRTGD